MAILSMILNIILVIVSGTDAVAVYTTGWRVVMFGIMSNVAIATSSVTVGGAAFGSRNYENLKVVHRYSVFLGIVMAAVTSIIVYVFAPFIAAVFTYSEAAAHLAPSIVAFLKVMCLFFLFVPPGIMSVSVFQAVGKGSVSFVLNLLRNLVFIALISYILAIVLGFGEEGVWWGIVLGDILGGIVGYAFADVYIRALIRNKKRADEISV